MYAIMTVIYGIPKTENAAEKINEYENDTSTELWFENDDGACGFTDQYSGSGSYFPGYCGVELDNFSEAQEYQRVDVLKISPTETQKAEAEAKIATLNPNLRALCPKIGVYIIFSTS